MKDFNSSKSNLKFTFEYDRNSINFLGLNVKLNNGKLTKIVYIKPTSILRHLIRTILNGQLFTVKLYWQALYVHLKKILQITLKI